MPSLVEIQYDPYRPNVSVLLNGKPPSAYSRLIQYSDEDLWKWADEILDVIYDELNDDFQLIFVGILMRLFWRNSVKMHRTASDSGNTILKFRIRYKIG